MELLRFQTSDETTKRVPDQKRAMTDLNAQGQAITKTEVLSWKTIRDPAKFSTITIFAEDSGTYSAALKWRIGPDGAEGEGLEYAFREVAPGMAEMQTVEVLGHFESAPSANEIHEICQDYLLLGAKYPIYADIVRKPLSPAIIEEILNHLLDEGDNPLPAWISRILGLRKGGTS